MQLTMGQNAQLAYDRFSIRIAGSSAVDISAVLVRIDGKVRSDSDFVFYNAATHNSGAVSLIDGAGASLAIDLKSVEHDIDRVVVLFSAEGRRLPGVDIALTHSDAGDFINYPMAQMDSETVAIACEIYRRSDAWKIRAIGQGYSNGLAGVATDFGISVVDSPGPASTEILSTQARSAEPEAPRIATTTPAPRVRVQRDYTTARQSYEARLSSHGDGLFGEFVELMKSVDNGVLDINSQWPRLADGIRAIVRWDPSKLSSMDRQIHPDLIRRSIRAWAQSASGLGISDGGWSKLDKELTEIAMEPQLFERDWSKDPITNQYPDACIEILDFDTLTADILRQFAPVRTVRADAVLPVLASTIQYLVKDFACHLHSPVEILVDDIAETLIARQGWEIGWTTDYLTYFGRVGALLYNEIVIRKDEVCDLVADFFVNEGQAERVSA
ncbi:hypothetical protein B2J88_08905 [Rhodococcus sp. SRB_17]|nr:hypothetical protein [Rhodococcus sp. SRB_17]